jgi:hypothetical protein
MGMPLAAKEFRSMEKHFVCCEHRKSDHFYPPCYSGPPTGEAGCLACQKVASPERDVSRQHVTSVRKTASDGKWATPSTKEYDDKKDKGTEKHRRFSNRN